MNTRFTRSLSFRLLVIGLLQLVIAVLVTDRVLTWNARPLDGERNTMTATVAEEVIAPLVDDPPALSALLARMHDRHGTEFSVYRSDGTLMASTTTPPLFFPGAQAGNERLPERTKSARFSKGPHDYVAMTRSAPKERPLPPLVIDLFAGLAGVILLVFVLGRWLVEPLRKLTSAARSFGSGDLAARVHLARGDELGEVGQAFDEMAERLQDLFLSTKELLANVSHELRTPLARIRVALELAAEGDPGAAQASLREIGVDLSELESIIDDILTTTNMELAERKMDKRAGFSMNEVEMNVADVLRQAETRFRARHPHRPLDLLMPPADGKMRGDPALLRRAIDNLLENAEKYSPEKDSPVTLSLAFETGWTLIEVADRGIGISAEDLSHVFEPFFRSERSRSRGTGGVGLGLTLVKRIIETHGGSVEATRRSEAQGGGAIFRIRLPRST